MERPVFDYSKLNGRIREKFGTQKKFADAIGVSPATVSMKLTNKRYFDQPEIMRAVNALGISDGDVSVYFFTPKLNIC